MGKRERSAERARLARQLRVRTEFPRGQSLEVLEKKRWGPPEYPSGLVTSCHRLRKVPVCDLTVEDLRLLIGQSIGLPFLVPIALEILRRDPLASGERYEGDLLSALLRMRAEFWTINPDVRARVETLLRRVGRFSPELAEAAAAFRDGT